MSGLSDAAIEAARIAYDKFFEPINGQDYRGIASWFVCGRSFATWQSAVHWMEQCRMRAAIEAALTTQPREGKDG